MNASQVLNHFQAGLRWFQAGEKITRSVLDRMKRKEYREYRVVSFTGQKNKEKSGLVAWLVENSIE